VGNENDSFTFNTYPTKSDELQGGVAAGFKDGTQNITDNVPGLSTLVEEDEEQLYDTSSDGVAMELARQHQRSAGSEVSRCWLLSFVHISMKRCPAVSVLQVCVPDMRCLLPARAVLHHVSADPQSRAALLQCLVCGGKQVLQTTPRTRRSTAASPVPNAASGGRSSKRSSKQDTSAAATPEKRRYSKPCAPPAHVAWKVSCRSVVWQEW